MRIKITIIILLLGTAPVVFSQSIGYQGKKFIAEIGYLPANTLAAKYFKYSLADDHYSDTEYPILVKHLPRVSIEYALFNSGSLEFKYNPFRVDCNMTYIDNQTNITDLICGETKGNMFSFGYKSYLTPTAAPLGTYFGVSATVFSFTSSFVESDFASGPAPQGFFDHTFEKDKWIGLFVSYGVQTIFWDKVTLDIALEGGYFFGDPTDYATTEPIAADDRYSLVDYYTPSYNNLINTRAYFFVVPSLNVGYLLF